MMDMNLKKEIMLDGVSLDLLPSSPDLMIVEGGAAGRSGGSGGGSGGSGRSSKREKDESAGLISAVMETLRGGGNVLLPVETAGRVLELMQILGKYWFEQKLGLYHLVFLSHMAENVTEFARMQLEWMSATLSRAFYNGNPNPFDQPQIRCATSIREIERCCPGPKVVLVTGADLSHGLSKELLLKWGGDPRSRVLFVDTSDKGSLAAELREKHRNPPVVVTVTRPVRVDLVGAELVQHRLEADKLRRANEEALQRKRRLEALSQVRICMYIYLYIYVYSFVQYVK
jgi:cleavage and polyadenylation specificity factor subunit 2